MFGIKEFYILASGAIQGHHGPLVVNYFVLFQSRNNFNIPFWHELYSTNGKGKEPFELKLSFLPESILSSLMKLNSTDFRPLRTCIVDSYFPVSNRIYLSLKTFVENEV